MIMRKAKQFKRVAALSLVGLLGVSTFAACGGGSGDDNENKSQLNIKVFNGGLGYAWLEELANNFMETFKDVSFEDGKKGVHIALTPNKQFDGLHSNMAVGADAEDIYYTATCDLYEFTDLNVAYDVTDIMTADVYDENGMVQLNATGDGWATQSSSIHDRINVDFHREALNWGTEAEPTYYALPFEDATSGIIVDWDLFKQEGWNSYNGIDGMPATISDFYDLLNKIRRKGYSAFIYSTSVGYYTPAIQSAVLAQVDGSDTYYDLFGDYTGEYDFNGDGTITEDEKVTPNTAYKLLDTKGYKAAVEMGMKMFEKNSSGQTYYDPSVTQGLSFGAAQQDFVMSKETETPIAMILEGEWWENETRGTFNAMGALNEENGYGKREFRMMPIPSFESTNTEQKYTLGAFSNGCVTVVNEKTVGGDTVKQRLAELWLQYQYSAEGLKCFTMHTGEVLPVAFEMNEQEMQELTPFARNMYALKRDPRVEIIYRKSPMQSEQVYRAVTKLNFDASISSVNYNTGSLFNNLVNLILANKTVTASEYIEGMHKYYDSKIQEAFKAE